MAKPESIRRREYNKAWMAARPGYGNQKRKERRQRVLDHYGARCACCGETENCFLTIDHINGGGSEHRRELNGRHLADWIIEHNFPLEFQILCWNCQWGKRMYGVCPHTRGNANG